MTAASPAAFGLAAAAGGMFETQMGAGAWVLAVLALGRLPATDSESHLFPALIVVARVAAPRDAMRAYAAATRRWSGTRDAGAVPLPAAVGLPGR